jgi:hypothetical protein
MIKTCIKKPEFFRAVQFTGDNLEEINKCNPNDYYIRELQVGERIVTDKHGCFKIFNDWEFRETYEEVRDEH